VCSFSPATKRCEAHRSEETLTVDKIVPGESGGLAMVIDRPREGDAVVQGEERPLLIVDASISSRLDDVVLDASTAPGEAEGPRFVLRHPER
jgi:hypothetical protein